MHFINLLCSFVGRSDSHCTIKLECFPNFLSQCRIFGNLASQNQLGASKNGARVWESRSWICELGSEVLRTCGWIVWEVLPGTSDKVLS
jgi:hypothetical protein